MTEPLPDDVIARILPGTAVLTDTRHTWSGIKKLPGNRLHVAAGGSTLSETRGADMGSVVDRLRETYPEVAGVAWQSIISGWVAMTTDLLPQIGRLGGGAWTGYGYCGRGLAGATLVGRELSRLAAEDAAHRPYVPVRDVKPLPFHLFGKYVVAAMVNWYRLADKLALRRSKHRELRK